MVLVDLDLDQCAPDLVSQHLPAPSNGMRFRVAVRAIESWLLADSERLAEYFGIRRDLIPDDPDDEQDPKQTVLFLAGRSRRQDIRRDLLPTQGSTARVGKAYNSRLTEFVQHAEVPWRPAVAATRSRSLNRCLMRLRSLL